MNLVIIFIFRSSKNNDTQAHTFQNLAQRFSIVKQKNVYVQRRLFSAEVYIAVVQGAIVKTFPFRLYRNYWMKGVVNYESTTSVPNELLKRNIMFNP